MGSGRVDIKSSATDNVLYDIIRIALPASEGSSAASGYFVFQRDSFDAEGSEEWKEYEWQEE